MFTKKIDHPVYGTIKVQKENFLEFHRTLAGLHELRKAAEEFSEKGGPGPEQMRPGFIKVKAGGKEIVYYKILSEVSGAEYTLGTTRDDERFPLYNRDDAYWEPDGGGPRPQGSREQKEPPQNESANSGDGHSGGGDTPHANLKIEPRRSEEADEIQKIKNASGEWSTQTLSQEHQHTIWRHLQRVRKEDPKPLLGEILQSVGAEDLEITYSKAEDVIEKIEYPSLMDDGAEASTPNPNDELPF